jgi:hypothetical protein
VARQTVSQLKAELARQTEFIEQQAEERDELMRQLEIAQERCITFGRALTDIARGSRWSLSHPDTARRALERGKGTPPLVVPQPGTDGPEVPAEV